MQYESVQFLYTVINWATLLVSGTVVVFCAKDSIEGHVKGDSVWEVLKKIRIRTVGAVVGIIGSVWVGIVRGYF